jgi:MFS family permease
MMEMAGALKKIPPGVVALGFVSMCMDTSSEMIHGLLPVFLVAVLGVGAIAVGLIEGIAEATAALAKIFSGAVSDWLRRRNPLLLLGYGLAAVVKPIFPLATSAADILAARFLDRIGKGIRGAPRDALIADLTPLAQRGAAYGLRQSLDTVGAFLGPAIALVLMAASGDDYRLVFWIAVVPAFASVLVILLFVRDAEVPAASAARPAAFRVRELLTLPSAFWIVVGFASFLTLARFSEAFLLLRANEQGLPAAQVPAILIVMNLVYAASAFPLGRLSDRMTRRSMLGFGIAVLVAADLMLAVGQGVAWVAAGSALWGLHMGATQGLLAAIVADAAPVKLRGSAFGLFHFAAGAALLMASVLAGLLWEGVGPAATFYAGAALAAASLVWLGFLR